MDRLDAMQVLLTVVDEGSLSAGSRKLNAPLTSVSRKVADLERHLGARLLIRSTRNIKLTDAGRDYVDTARQVVAVVRDAEQRAGGEYEAPRGALRVSATLEFGRSILTPLAGEFLSEHPEITLSILASNRYVDLTEENIDLGVRVGELSDSALMAVKVGTVRGVTCASPEYLARKGRPEQAGDLSGHDSVLFRRFSLNRANGRWALASPSGASNDTGPVVRVHANDAATACSATVQGLGISRLPSYLVAEHLRSGALVEIFEEYAEPHPVHLVYVRQGLLPRKTRAFIDWMTPRLRYALNG